MDLYLENTKKIQKKLGAKFCIAFSPDGIMLLMWTDGISRKYRNLDQIKIIMKEVSRIFVTPGQYFSFIHKGVLLLFQQDTIGGFVLGKK